MSRFCSLVLLLALPFFATFRRDAHFFPPARFSLPFAIHLSCELPCEVPFRPPASPASSVSLPACGVLLRRKWNDRWSSSRSWWKVCWRRRRAVRGLRVAQELRAVLEREKGALQGAKRATKRAERDARKAAKAEGRKVGKERVPRDPSLRGAPSPLHATRHLGCAAEDRTAVAATSAIGRAPVPRAPPRRRPEPREPSRLLPAAAVAVKTFPALAMPPAPSRRLLTGRLRRILSRRRPPRRSSVRRRTTLFLGPLLKAPPFANFGYSVSFACWGHSVPFPKPL